MTLHKPQGYTMQNVLVYFEKPESQHACENAVADVMFVLDESGSVGSNNYKKMKEFVSHIVKSFPIGPKHVRVGAIRFAKVTTPQFALNSYNDKNLVLKGINSIPYRGGNTKTHKALNYLRTTSFTQAAGDRKDAPNIAIILTDGKSTNQRETITAAKKLRNANVIVFAIGIGNNLNELELKEIGNSPTDKYVFTVNNFDALKSIETDPCDAKPCKNSGVCKSKGNSYTCTCKTGYSGENCDKACENAVADVMFVLDESGSVGSNNYKKMKEFVSHIVKSFPIGPKHVRVGAIRFAKVTTPQFALNSYNDKNLVLKGINSIPYRGGNTKTHKALNYLRTTSFTQAAGDRKDAPNIAIILTDGKSTNQRETITAAKKLRNANVIVFAIGIGNNLNELELKEIGNSPTDKYVFTVNNFDALKSIETDPCDAKPCKNSGVCKSKGNSYTCTCKTGYSGENCDKVDPCAAKPCKNGGVCESNGNSYKCTCKAGYSGTNCDTVDPCAAKPCKNGGVCESNGNSYKCTCKAGYSGTNCDTVIPDCVCKVAGDPHYATFDGQLIHFMGTCKYTLASTTKGSSLMAFSVEAKNEHRLNNKKVSYIRMVDVKVNGVTLRLLPGHTVLVNKQILQMPLKNFLAFNATYSAGWVTVTTTFGLKVKFDGNHRVYIYVSGEYRGQLTGLCGDCNSKRDDFRTKEGVDVSKKANKYSLIGKSYQVPDDSDKPEKVCNVTDITTDCDLKITGVCELMTHENGIFGQCVKSLGKEVARQYLDSCKIDVCAYSMTAKYKKSATCKSFESFVKECEAKDVLVNWRGVLGCQLDCSTWANTMYKFNANTTILSSDCSVSVTCLGNGKIHESSSCPSGSDCLIEFGQRMCKCPDGYAPLNGECKKTLKPPPSPIIDPAFLQPVMHMFIRVSVAYIKGTFLEELKFEHVEKCAHRCMNNTKCKSFNFDDLVKTCQLYSISAATGITLTPSECPYREYYQRIDSKTVVIYGATITTCIHISEYSNIKTEAECKKLRIKGNYTAMEYSKFFKGCGVTHNAEKTYGLTGNIFWKFELMLDEIPKMTN
ncbi:zonadhesin-like [Octopus vulgaris]|uniref:Zonadhesin-like n=1 Tax=Octopus vulgaris TaxID=6645 RepID=A0AA36ARS6_OCTVU|nr:zonadhesin-like [Octopus vulgaris]